jgi:3',5'-cyclic AMP phosphodiesterase CpdA
VRIVGLYSNVVPGGYFEDSQTEWLTAELAAAPAGKPLIVALHHPPYSVDSMHGGSVHVGEVLDKAFDDSARTPELVLSGHVHDYQRFSRRRGDHTTRSLRSHQLILGQQPRGAPAIRRPSCSLALLAGAW